ncbi:MAG: cysteine synthase family protein [Lentisphaeria bacterium]|nr:cysteine synthase family protein [Lentisphaeria bacterium]
MPATHCPVLDDFSVLMKQSTPVMRLRGFDVGESVVYVGLACLNPSGSVKDVMAWHMLRKARERGAIKSGDTILEVTTGNTGIAFAMLSALCGYKFVAVMPEHMSVERRQIMRAYGADVVLTPKEEDIPGALRRYRELAEELAPNVWLPDQFANEDNVEAHYLTTGENLARSLPERIDVFVAGVGTGGTFLGVSRRLREFWPECLGVVVEPAESAVLSGGEANLHGIQGIGEGFVPDLIKNNRDEIGEVAVVSTAEAEETARTLALKSGFFAGVSSGANIAAAVRYAKARPGCRVVTLIPDRGERYLNQGLFCCRPEDCACSRHRSVGGLFPNDSNPEECEQ